MSDKDKDLVGRVLANKYRIVRRLGAGGMGSVYLATRVDIGGEVALKVLGGMFVNEGLKTRFKREAAALSALRHPNIVDLHDFGQEGDLQYLVQEYVAGRTLHREITSASGGALPWVRVLGICRQVVLALAVAHGLKILHRDLKPANIMLVDLPGVRDHVKVLDFGIAKLLDSDSAEVTAWETITQTGFIIGTPAYMSPEQGKGTEVLTPASDFYSLGVIMYHALTGKVPFKAPSTFQLVMAHLHDPVPPLEVPEGMPPIPGSLRALVDKLLAKDPKDRPQDAGELVDAMDRILMEQGYRPMHAGSVGSLALVGRSTVTEARPQGQVEASRAPVSRESGDHLTTIVFGGRARKALVGGAVALALVGAGAFVLSGRGGGREVHPLRVPSGADVMATGEGGEVAAKPRASGEPSPAPVGRGLAAPGMAGGVQARSGEAASQAAADGGPGAASPPTEGTVRLELVSEPPGAVVTFDGRPIGQTPVQLPLPPDRARDYLDPGKYRVTLEGYEFGGITFSTDERDGKLVQIRGSVELSAARARKKRTAPKPGRTTKHKKKKRRPARRRDDLEEELMSL